MRLGLLAGWLCSGAIVLMWGSVCVGLPAVCGVLAVCWQHVSVSNVGFV